MTAHRYHLLRQNKLLSSKLFDGKYLMIKALTENKKEENKSASDRRGSVSLFF